MFYHKDPRRVQPLVDFLVEAFMNLDFNAELSFDAVKIATLFRAFYTGLGRKFLPWTDQTVDRFWTEIYSDHEDVRTLRGSFPLPFADALLCNRSGLS